MTEGLIAAYRSTRYAVLDPDGGTLAEAMIGRTSDDIDAVLDAHGATTGVFITAWNPRSLPVDETVNAVAHTRLVAEVDELGLVALPHVGFGVDPAWRPEHGLLVLGLTEADARVMAESYGQNAVVVVERGRPAALVLTDVMRA